MPLLCSLSPSVVALASRLTSLRSQSLQGSPRSSTIETALRGTGPLQWPSGEQLDACDKSKKTFSIAYNHINRIADQRALKRYKEMLQTRERSKRSLTTPVGPPLCICRSAFQRFRRDQTGARYEQPARLECYPAGLSRLHGRL